MKKQQWGLAGTAGLLLVAGTGFSTLRSSAAQQATVLPVAHVALVFAPGIHLGADNKMHDAATPTDFTAVAGQHVVVTVYNYDTGQHAMTSSGLRLNVIVKAAKRTGVPAVTTFSFVAPKAGTYTWHCTVPCDDDARGWAMSHHGYLSGVVTITRA